MSQSTSQKNGRLPQRDPSPALLAVLERLGVLFASGDSHEVSELRAQVSQQRATLERMSFELGRLSAQMEASKENTTQRAAVRQEMELWLATQPELYPDKPHIDRAAAKQAEKAQFDYMCVELNDMLGIALAENEMADAELAAMAEDDTFADTFADVDADQDAAVGHDPTSDTSDGEADADAGAADAGDAAGDNGSDGGDSGAGDGAGGDGGGDA